MKDYLLGIMVGLAIGALFLPDLIRDVSILFDRAVRRIVRQELAAEA